MAGDAPYTNMDPEESAGKRWCKRILKWSVVIVVVLYLVVLLIQFCCYQWATIHCNAGQLKDYSFPGGGAKNLVPKDTLLAEQEPKWWGSSFVSYPADKDGQTQGASTGVYFRTWGPLFWTVTYQDIVSKETFVIRDKMIHIGGSHQIKRCDGIGPIYTVQEGSHVVMNWIRSLFGMYNSRVYNIYEDNTMVAVSSKLGGQQSHKQMVFRRPDDENPFASCFLKSRHFHGQFDQWFVEVKEDSPLPNFVPNAVTVLMAFGTAAQKSNKEKNDEAAKTDDAGFLEVKKTDDKPAMTAEQAWTAEQEAIAPAAEEEEQQQQPEVALAEASQPAKEEAAATETETAADAKAEDLKAPAVESESEATEATEATEAEAPKEA